MRERQAATQAADVPSDRPGESTQFLEGRIPLPPFYPAYVARGGVRLERKVLLRQTFGLPRVADSLAQELERGRLSQRLEAQPEDNFPSSHYSGDFVLALPVKPGIP
jgi:hypothetical protein